MALRDIVHEATAESLYQAGHSRVVYLTYTTGTGRGQMSGRLTEDGVRQVVAWVKPLLGPSCTMSILRK